MEVVSVINYKGGVGKTTLVANVGAELSWRGYDVLLLDMDAQASLTFSFITPEYWASNLEHTATIKQWFDAIQTGEAVSLEGLAIPPRFPFRGDDHGRLRLVPSHLGLLNVDLELAAQLSGATLAQAKRSYLRVHGQLRDAMSELEDAGYDIVLIDCPPNFNIVTKNAIAASDHILVPARPDYLSTMGVDYLIRSVGELVRDYNDYAELDQGADIDPIRPEIIGVVFTMVQVYAERPIASQRAYIAQTARLQGATVFNSWIRRHPRVFGDAPREGRPAVITSDHLGVRRELEEVVDEFVEKVGLK